MTLLRKSTYERLGAVVGYLRPQEGVNRLVEDLRQRELRGEAMTDEAHLAVALADELDYLTAVKDEAQWARGLAPHPR